MMIGLLGFEFESSNKGCEALTYSVMPILKNISEDLTIVVFNIHDSLGAIPNLYPQISFINVPIKMKSFSFYTKLLKYYHKCNFILDITHGDSFSDIYGTKWYRKTCFLKQLANKINKRLILMPQTYGPYICDKNKKIAKDIITNSFAVYSRDNKSTDYIRLSLKINRDIFTTADLAFMLPFEKINLPHNRINLGINVSGLLWNLERDKVNKIALKVNYQQYIKKVIKVLYATGKYNIYLIPHVLCEGREGTDYYDNDEKAISELKQLYPFCICPNGFNNVLDVKNYISSLDILIAARMHASIAAFSSGICSIPFAYSRKFAGVYEDLGYDYIIDGENFDTEYAIKKTVDYVNGYKDLASISKKCMSIVMNNNREFITSFYNCLRGNPYENDIA